MEISHDPRGLEVGRIFGIELLLLVARDEGKGADVLVEFREGEIGRDLHAVIGKERKLFLLFRFEIVKHDPREVGNDDVARDLAVLAVVEEGLDVTERLRLRLAEIPAERLVLDDEVALPKEVDKPVMTGDFLHGRFEAGYGFPRNTEDFKKLVPERLFVGGFARGF